MQIIESLVDLPDAIAPCAVTLGNFDGVHLGHRELFRHLVKTARQLNCPAVVYTFDPHPLKFLAPDRAPKLLNTPAEKERLIAASHVDYLIKTPFTAEFAAMTPEQFVEDILLAKLHIKALVVGYDYAFGKGRRGNADFLQACGVKYGFSVEVLQPVGADGLAYSSTRIRNLVAAGDMAGVVGLLGRQYNLEGQVVPGDQRGRELGYPTANLQTDKELLPAPGVYVVKVRNGSQEYGGVVSLGNRPTFGGKTSTIEVHLLDYTGQLYGQTLRIYFVERLRGEVKFSSSEELVSAIAADVLQARQILQSTQIIQYREYLSLK
ncbi:FMN adenylyltransferase /riboflavin kinase [Desulfuromusa kysingii]|uniref:Riboflavin biosynthesis protein n=1 Tax=Desulfuromusa kysingii TaxID=37625 RepID=A0A1H4E9K3_9BACT|nr:bifunctional riboflavin kinase/FAD synthetase [Desulfuromusa kysingii]SEA81489.1 FMN adenylyltransferase /riboflavin kinase [Desulfuromusa kysingii]